MSEPSLQDRYAPRNRCFGCGPANEKGLQELVGRSELALPGGLAQGLHMRSVEQADIELHDVSPGAATLGVGLCR